MKSILKIFILVLILLPSCSSAKDYERRVKRVIDGDTIELITDEESDLIKQLGYRVRINGIDTPEKRADSLCEREKARYATEFLSNILKQGSIVKISNIAWDKYGGRILADVSLNDQDIASLMVKNGHAIKYNGEKKTYIWCK